MRPWAFHQFVTDWNEWAFRDWYNAQDPHVRAAFDAIRAVLERTDDWLDPPIKEFELFTGDHVPLGEIRFRADNLDRAGRLIRKRKIRPVGLLRPVERDFLLFGGAEEAPNGAYVPHDALTRAMRRYEEFKANKGMVYVVD